MIGFATKEDVSFDLKAFEVKICNELNGLLKKIEKSLENKIK